MRAYTAAFPAVSLFAEGKDPMATAASSVPAVARHGTGVRLPGRAATAPPRISAVIVNYRQWRETYRLARQLLRTPFARAGMGEVIVVDNHSPPHRLIGRLRRMPGLSLRRWGHNRGFARAVNEGWRLSRGDWVLLLNPDMTLEPDFLARADAIADELSERSPRVGIVGFRLRHGDGTAQASFGPFPSLPGTLARLLLPRARRKYHAADHRGRRRVPWVTGCCLLVSAQCLREVGGLDEDFFLYYEDVDLCRRARAAGWSVWYDARLGAAHYRPLHRRAVPGPVRLAARHALLTYAHKHWPAWQTRLLAGIVMVEARLRRWRARWQRERFAAGRFRRLEAIARDIARGRCARARRRLDRALRREEARLGP